MSIRVQEIYAGEIKSLNVEATEKRVDLRIIVSRLMVVFWMSRIKIDKIRNALQIPNELLTLSRRKNLRGLFTWYTKTVPIISSIHTRITLPTEDPVNDHQSDHKITAAKSEKD